MEQDDIEFVGFHEEVDDINEKLKHLVDSHDHIEKIFLETIKKKEFRSEIDCEVCSMIEVANDVKLIIESILFLLPHSTSIPCLRDLRWKLIRLVYISNGLRSRSMQWYESRVVHRLKRFWREVTTRKKNLNLSIQMFLSRMKDYPTGFLVYEEDIELIATMHKVVKERHEEMIKIEKRMIELEQVLFQMYGMVQEKLVILVNEQQLGDDDYQINKEESENMMKTYDSVEHLVGTIMETYQKRELMEAYQKRKPAKHDRTSPRILFMVLILSVFIICLVLFSSERGWIWY